MRTREQVGGQPSASAPPPGRAAFALGQESRRAGRGGAGLLQLAAALPGREELPRYAPLLLLLRQRQLPVPALGRLRRRREEAPVGGPPRPARRRPLGRLLPLPLAQGRE